MFRNASLLTACKRTLPQSSCLRILSPSFNDAHSPNGTDTMEQPKQKILAQIFDLAPRPQGVLSLDSIMASSEVDTKFLGKFADNLAGDSPFLASQLYQLLGNLTMLSPYVIKARKERRLDPTRHTKSMDLYCRIIWYARGGLLILEQYILPMINQYTELRCLANKLRASYYHLYVLFHNSPPISLKAVQLHTPPGLRSPRERAVKLDKGKGVDRGSPGDPFRPSSVQPTHPLEGGPVGGHGRISPHPVEYAPDFLVPAADYRPVTLEYFEDACALGESKLWGSHPLYLSARVEMCAFLYDCLHERDRSRQMAKTTIAEVYNAKEGMDDDMFEDSAELVGILGRMMKRGLGSSSSAAGSSGTRTTAGVGSQAVPTPGMINPI